MHPIRKWWAGLKPKDRVSLLWLVLAAIGLLCVLWVAGGPTVRPAIISGVFTLFAAIGGVFVVSYQLRRQAENTQEANKQNETMKLKTGVYSNVLELTDAALHATYELDQYLLDSDFSLQLARVIIGQDPSLPPLKAHLQKLRELERGAASHATSVISFVENWNIMEPQLDLFQIAIADALAEFWEASHEYFSVSVRILPQEPTSGGQAIFLSDESTTELKERANKVRAKLGTLRAYIADFGREAQTMLLGPLFDRAARRRSPTPPAGKAIRLDHYAELKAHFEAKMAKRYQLEADPKADKLGSAK
jgi:hypothetical protein